MINENWEQPKNLSDILRIVSENISDEFAQKVKEICEEPILELEEQKLILLNSIIKLNNRNKNIKKIFKQVLKSTNANFSNNEYEFYIEKFDSIWNGDEISAMVME